MSKLFVMVCLSLIFNAHAEFNFAVDDICSANKIANKRSSVEDINLGDFTVKYLTENKIEFKGSKEGISSIKNSPVGDAALKILSDTEMLAFGWCYSINDQILEKMPDEVLIDSSVNSIRWYFGFAHYLDGEWISQCEDNKETVRRYFCSNP